MLCAAKAQIPTDTTKAKEVIIKVEYPEDHWRQVRYNLLQRKDTLAKSCYCIVIYEKKNEPPVDMMVRHYFAISYWD